MSPKDKPLVLLSGEIRTPPLSKQARAEAGYLLRQLQQGATLSMPYSRPMPDIGAGVHELRINDGDVAWRVVYRADPDAVLVIHVFAKKTRTTPKAVIAACRKRLAAYDRTKED